MGTGVNKRVTAALNSLYNDICTVYEYVEVEKDSGATGHEEAAVYENIPCRLSYVNAGKDSSHTQQSDTADYKEKTIKLFLDTETEIKAGSKIIVERLGQQTTFKSSSEAARYPSHQEIALEIYEGEA